MWLPLQLAAEMTCTCFPSFTLYVSTACSDRYIKSDNNNNAHFGYVHHLNNRSFATCCPSSKQLCPLKG